MLEELLNSDKVEAQLTQLWRQGKQDEALALIHDYTSRLDTVADYCGEQGQYEQAEIFYVSAQKIYRAFLSEDTAFALSLNGLACLYYNTAQYAQSEPLYQEALQVWRVTVGEAHPWFAGTLNNLGQLLMRMGRYAEAESLFERALDIRRHASTAGHPDITANGVAESLNNLGMLLHRLGKYAEAEPLLLEALEIRRQAAETDPGSFATSLHNLGLLYEAAGDYELALSVTEQASHIWREVLGEKHLTYAACLDNLGVLHHSMGDYEQAERHLRRALEVRRDTLGERHPLVAASLNNCARLYQEVGRYQEAGTSYRQALEIYRATLGDEHFEIAQSLDNLASLEAARGNYKQAEELYLQALDMTGRTLGTSHPAVARCMNSLAVLYITMGKHDRAQALLAQALDILHLTFEKNSVTILCLDNLAALHYTKGDYVRAETLYQRALALRCEMLGEDHPDVVQSLNSLALLYRLMGDNAKANAFYEQALTRARSALGEEHPDVAMLLNNMALLYGAQGDFAREEKLLQRALDIWHTTLAEDHPYFAATLNNLAETSRARGDYTQAEYFTKRALEMRRRAFGDTHLDVASSLSSLAVLYDGQGRYNEAEPLYREALAVQRSVLGDVPHPDVAQTLRHIGALYAATNRPAEALDLAQQAAVIDDQIMGQVFSMGSENQRLMYLSTLQEALDSFLSLILYHLSHSLPAVQLGLDLVLRRKALSAEVLMVQREAVLQGRYPALRSTLEELITLRTQIARKLLMGPGPEDNTAYQHALRTWRAQQEQMESELAHHIPEMNLARKLREVNRHLVAGALPPDAVMVEFVCLDGVNFHAIPAQGQSQWQPAHYLAFILVSQDAERVRVIDLGDASAINALIHAYSSYVSREPLLASSQDPSRQKGTLPEQRGDGRNLVAGLIRRGPGVEGDASGRSLRRFIFDPLVPAFRGHKRLLLVPDGDLALLPFEVLPTDDGGYLIDEYQISYLSAGRDLLRFTSTPVAQRAPGLVVADPDFDLRSDADSPSGAAGDSGKEPAGRRSLDLDRGGRFERLPGTAIEGEQIAALLQVQPLVGNAALDARVKASHSPFILHMATHGFFLPDQPPPLREKPLVEEALDTLEASSGNRLERLVKRHIENPLLRSGLVLAGANTWSWGGSLPEEAEDGLLTAEDVASMDLSDTAMVVLSACETGLGQVHLGEGVFGLRRAFALAGARTLVMSLWKVPDRQTQQLMVDFYRRILAGQPRVDALREAQIALKEQYPHPHYWGAFICQGDAGPLIRLSQ